MKDSTDPFDFGDTLRESAVELDGLDAKPKRGGKRPDFNRQTREFFEKRGYHYSRADRFERKMRFNPATKRVEDEGGHYRDLFGFMDSIAFKRQEPGVTAVQITGRSAIGSRIRSAVTNDSGDRLNANRGVRLVDWILAGNRFWVIGWEKPGRFWVPTIINVTLETVRHVQGGGRLEIAKLPRVEI